MTRMSSRLVRAALAAAAGFVVLFAAEKMSPSQSGLITTAEAVIGRPLTPMSYAGVARGGGAQHAGPGGQRGPGRRRPPATRRSTPTAGSIQDAREREEKPRHSAAASPAPAGGGGIPKCTEAAGAAGRRDVTISDRVGRICVAAIGRTPGPGPPRVAPAIAHGGSPPAPYGRAPARPVDAPAAGRAHAPAAAIAPAALGRCTFCN